MKPFEELTERGQLQRLRQLAISALDNYSLDVKRVRLLGNETNCSFRVDAVDGQAYVLRVSSFDGGYNQSDTDAEIAWLTALQSSHDITVPRPVAARDGSMFVIVEAAGVPGPRRCVLMTMLPGRNLDEKMSNESMHELGKLTAQLHRFARTHNPLSGFNVRSLGTLYPFGESEVLFDPQFAKLYPGNAREIVWHCKEAVQAAIDELYSGPGKPIIIHGDIHQWNVLIYRGQLYVIDHEDVMRGFPVQDIGVTFHYLQRRTDYLDLRQHYISGYETVALWPESYPGEVDLFVIHRGLHLMNYVLNGLSDDPDLIAHFMEYPVKYWEPILNNVCNAQGA